LRAEPFRAEPFREEPFREEPFREEIVRIQGGGIRLTAAAFSPEGNRLVLVAEGGVAEVWNLEGTLNGERIVLPVDDSVTAVAWGPAGERLLIATADGALGVWRLDAVDPVAALRSAIAICLTPEFREKQLGEPSTEAVRRFEDCERQAKTVDTSKDSGQR
jgi:WD40 repeat protein